MHMSQLQWCHVVKHGQSDPLYVSEISPASQRGQLVTWSEVGINVGTVLGFSTGLLFDDYPPGDAWRAMCLLGMTFPLTTIILTIGILPETPRWFVLKKKDDDARMVLQDIYPEGTSCLQ